MKLDETMSVSHLPFLVFLCRWLITVSDFRTRNQLLCSGLTLDENHFVLRRWDNLVMEDYRMHLRRSLARQRLLDTLSDSWEASHLDGIWPPERIWIQSQAKHDVLLVDLIFLFLKLGECFSWKLIFLVFLITHLESECPLEDLWNTYFLLCLPVSKVCNLGRNCHTFVGEVFGKIYFPKCC